MNDQRVIQKAEVEIALYRRTLPALDGESDRLLMKSWIMRAEMRINFARERIEKEGRSGWW